MTDLGTLYFANRVCMKGEQVGFGQRCAGFDDDAGAPDFAPFVVGNADQRGFGDGRMGVHDAFDLSRVDVLAAADDHVLEPPDDRIAAVGVADRQIAGVEPAVDDRLGGRFGVVPVAGGDVPAPDDQLARFAGIGLGSIRADGFDVDVKERVADRARFAPDFGGGQPEGVGSRFGESVAGLEIDALFPEALEDRQRAGRAAADDQLQAREIGVLPALVACMTTNIVGTPK